MKKQDKDKLIENLPEGRRSFLKKAMTAGFVVPTIASFTMSGLMSRPAAAHPNMSGNVHPHPHPE